MRSNGANKKEVQPKVERALAQPKERPVYAGTTAGKDTGDSSLRDTSWVSHQSGLQLEYKRGVSAYTVSHLLGFGLVVQMGSGTTQNALMAAIIEHQGSQQKPLDLTILTTNLEIAQMGKEAAVKDPRIFGSTQIIITGGTLLPSLNSLVGNYAADNVKTTLIMPHIVFIGVAGIGFDEPDGRITYHFDQELSTQESYATRPTSHRVVVCDHTKLGRTTRWKSKTSLRSLTQNTDECTILSSYPDESDSDFEQHREATKEQMGCFRNLMESWHPPEDEAMSDEELAKRVQLRLRLINCKGEVVEEEKLWPDLD